MFQDYKIGVSIHAVKRFKERVDPTATASQIIEYVKQSVLSDATKEYLTVSKYSIDDALFHYRSIETWYKHVTFVIARKHGRGVKQILVITCY